MKATVDWTGNASFKATRGSGHSVPHDGSPDHGGENRGQRPQEMPAKGRRRWSAVHRARRPLPSPLAPAPAASHGYKRQNDSFVMNKWKEMQGVENIDVIPDGSGEFTRRMGMLVAKDNLGFGARSWRYAAIVNDGKIEAWFEEPGICDNHDEDPYGVSSPENLLDYLANVQKTEAA